MSHVVRGSFRRLSSWDRDSVSRRVLSMLGHDGAVHDALSAADLVAEVRRTVIALVALYCAYFLVIAAARRHATAEGARLAAERNVQRYQVMLSGARTATPTELGHAVANWLRTPPAFADLPPSVRAQLVHARHSAGDALIARSRVVLSTPGYLDPDERRFLTRSADSIVTRNAEER